MYSAKACGTPHICSSRPQTPFQHIETTMFWSKLHSSHDRPVTRKRPCRNVPPHLLRDNAILSQSDLATIGKDISPFFPKKRTCSFFRRQCNHREVHPQKKMLHEHGKKILHHTEKRNPAYNVSYTCRCRNFIQKNAYPI